MYRPVLLAAAIMAAVPGVSGAQVGVAPPAPELRNLSAADADSLIGTLKDAQARLRDGQALYFELLSGAPASYAMTQVPPRQAFLDVSFDKPVLVERIATDNRLWQPYRLTIAPDGPGRALWFVEAVLGINGDLERVEMVLRPPAPF